MGSYVVFVLSCFVMSCHVLWYYENCWCYVMEEEELNGGKEKKRTLCVKKATNM